MRDLLLSCFCVLLMSSIILANNIYIDDGLPHTINDTRYINDNVWLDYYINNDPGTSFNLISGGEIGAFLYAYNESSVNLDGGIIHGGLWAYGNSNAIVESGNIAVDLASFGNSSIDLNGGVVTGVVYAAGESTINMHGGSVIWVYASKQGRINLEGGTVASILLTRETGTIYVKGSDFEVTTSNGTLPLVYGDRLSGYGTLSNDELNDYLTGTLSGILEDGAAVSNVFNIYDTSDIVIVPEPVSLWMFVAASIAVLRKNS